jgi:hypothetical protein
VAGRERAWLSPARRDPAPVSRTARSFGGEQAETETKPEKAKVRRMTIKSKQRALVLAIAGLQTFAGERGRKGNVAPRTKVAVKSHPPRPICGERVPAGRVRGNAVKDFREVIYGF